MSVKKIGLGSYSTVVPEGAASPQTMGGAPAVPLVSGEAANAPVPTNDWWSSLVFNYFESDTSAPLYADPMTLKADSTGIQIGYQSQVTYIDGPGLQVEDNIQYKYFFSPGLHVGVEDLGSGTVTVSDYGDWTVTADWADAGGGGMEATFGHGLPFVYFTRSGDGAAVIDVLEAAPISRVGNPASPLVYEVSGLTGAFSGGTTAFTLPIDAGSSIANGPQVRISYDFNGDGKFDRIETYNYFPADAGAGWETYTQGAGLFSATGAMADFSGGSVKLEIWNAIGEGSPSVRTDTPAGEANPSRITLPFSGLTASGEAAGTLYLRAGATPDTPSALSPVAGTAASADIMGNTQENLSWDGKGEVWYNSDGVVGVTIQGVHYGIFGPAGVTWVMTETGLKSDLGGAETFSVAVLPEKSLETLQYFAAHADNAVTDSTVAFDYDAATNTVTQTFSVTTSTGEDPLTALYRHQWINTDENLTDFSYVSAKGEMKLAEDSDFTVTYAASPLLPVLPLLDDTYAGLIRQYLLADVAELNSRSIKIPFQDTYTAGKELGRLAELAQIANQIGETEIRDTYLAVIKAELEDWFTAGTGDDKHFAYNEEWGTLIGYPASFDSEKQLNDHNFHYGYFVQAAATVGMFDDAWASQDQWGGMVDLLIADVANTDRDSDLFPYLRSLDPYAGHSWASGHAAFASGNNLESSSESLNFAAAVALWGAVTDREDVRDFGIALHSMESAAVLQYWFDVDDAVFPDEFPYEALGMVWSDGGSHTTWFSDDPERIHGINLMPFSAATSLHLATEQAEILANYAEMAAESGGEPRYWKNIQWSYLALANPDQALAELMADPDYSLNEGGSGSYAQTLFWIASLASLGTLNADIRADTPFHAVFAKDGINTYIAYNTGTSEFVVHFTDGVALTVAPETMSTLRDGEITVFDLSSDTVAEPDPGTDPGTDPEPDPDTDPGTDPGTDPDPAPVTAGLILSGGALAFDPSLGAVTLASADGANHDGTPHAPASFTISEVSGRYDASATGFSLKIDAAGAGDAVQAAISYDFNGDGTFDRVETYHYFATDPVSGWETYGANWGLKSATGGAMRDLDGGSVKIELWTALGIHAVAVGLAASSLDLPFAFGDGSGEPTDPETPEEPETPTEPETPAAGDGLILSGGQIGFDPERGVVTLASAQGRNQDGSPFASTKFTMDDLTASYQAGQAATFALKVDAGGAGDAVQAAISYDFDGNGTVDRVETYRYFATDPVAGWETYGASWGLSSVTGGALRDFAGGTVTVELWTALGTHAVKVDLAASILDLPFASTTTGPGPTPDPDPEPEPEPEPDPDVVGNGLVLVDGTVDFDATRGAVMLAAAGGANHDGAPHAATSLTLENLTAQHIAGQSAGFVLKVDAGSGAGDAVQAAISYDFNGDGTFDRVETYAYFATNDASGWETYANGWGLKSVTGAPLQDLAGGTVKVDLWSAIGTHQVAVDLAASSLDLPFAFSGGSSPGTEPEPAPEPEPEPEPQVPTDGDFLVSAAAHGVTLTTASAFEIESAGHGRYVDAPHDALVLTAEDIHGAYNGGRITFDLPIDAGTGIANGTQLRLTFDFDGDGAADRTETYLYFETDNAVGAENYTTARALTNATGDFQDFTGGSVTAEIWNSLGGSTVTLASGATITLPHDEWLA